MMSRAAWARPRASYLAPVFDPGPGLIVFLVALFLAVIGATVFVVAVRRGVVAERANDGEPDE